MSTCLLTINLEDENGYTSHPFLQNNKRAGRNSRNQAILRHECFKNYMYNKTGGKVALPSFAPIYLAIHEMKKTCDL